MNRPIFNIKSTPGTVLVGGIRHGPEYMERINRRAAELEAARKRKEDKPGPARLPGCE